MCGIGLVVLAVRAADIFVGADQVVTNYVAEGESFVQSGTIAVATDGELRKTGGGAWTVPKSTIGPRWPLAVSVVNGSVAVTGGESSENPVPAVIDKAALWVSAKDSAHIVKAEGSDQVTAWYDVREKDVANCQYLFATPNHKYTREFPAQRWLVRDSA